MGSPLQIAIEHEIALLCVELLIDCIKNVSNYTWTSIRLSFFANNPGYAVSPNFFTTIFFTIWYAILPKVYIYAHGRCTLCNYSVTYGYLGTNQKYQGVLIFQVSLYDKAPFGTTTKSVDYAGVLIFKCPDQQVSLYNYITDVSKKRLY